MPSTKSHLRPDHMPGDVVPREAEVVAAGRIDAALQQRGNGFRTGEAAAISFLSIRPPCTPHVVATCCKGRRKAPASLTSAIILGVEFSLAAVPCRVQHVVNAIQPTGEILFCERFLPDICSHPLWWNDLLFPEALFLDKAAKAVQFMLCQLYFRSEREKANLLAAPNQS